MNNSSISNGVGLKDNTTPFPNFWALLAQHPDYRTHLLIWKIWPPIIFFLGIFGNMATIFVMRRIKDHNSSQYAILMVLAVSDLTFLGSGTMITWVRFFFQVDLRSSHVAVCKISRWLLYVSGTTSAWLVTCVTVQRTMAVLWPHRMRVMCTVRRTWIVIVSLVLTVCVLDSHLLVGFEIAIMQNNLMCIPMAGVYGEFIGLYFTWVFLFMSSIIPSVCLFVCDIILSITLFRAVSSSAVAAPADSNATSLHNTDTRRKMSLRTTVMVLAISCAFLVLTLPVCVHLIWFNNTAAVLFQSPKAMAMAKLLESVTYQLSHTNSSVNFFLYILTGTKFRREFVNWFRCGAVSPASSVQEATSEASRGGRHK